MAEKFDVIIIGAGITGCFAARHLSRYELKTLVLEKREDVCTGITRAGSGIIYRGYDQHPDSLKAKMCVKASRGFADLCESLDVPFRRCGLLMLSFGPRADEVLEKKKRNGMQLKIGGLHLIDGSRVYEMEPSLRPGVKKALYSEDTGVVDPWELGIAAFENAAANGAEFHFNEKVVSIKRYPGSFCVETECTQYEASRVLCCAGLEADVLWEMAAKPVFRIIPQAADYLVFDVMKEPCIRHIISVEPEEKGQGLTVIPTVNNNLLAGPTRRKVPENQKEDWFETEEEGLMELSEKVKSLFPDLSFSLIRTFGSVRPNPFYLEGKQKEAFVSGRSIPDFMILEEDGFFSLAGIKTPGITCADELGRYITEKITASFSFSVKKKENPVTSRKGIVKPSALSPEERRDLIRKDPLYGTILCRCRQITRGEVQEAILRGAVTLDGVKRRTGAGMGRCQGGFCSEKILKMISEQTGKSIYEICKDRKGSEFLGERREDHAGGNHPGGSRGKDFTAGS